MSDQASARPSHVLIIDDDATSAVTLQMYLVQQNFQASVAKTGQDGISEALVRLPSLIVLSSRLPDMSGRDVFQQLRSRARTASIPVMIVADRADAAQQNELLGAGADDFIQKPFDLDILTLRVRNTIKRQQREGLTNPRSGLATGRLILERVRALSEETDWYKIDFAIANFDSFKEKYGFMTSEEALAFTAKLIYEVVQATGTPEDFIGHRDDNEFVIITRLANGLQLRTRLEERFNEEVKSFYTFIERDQGYIEVDDGSGGLAQKPLMAAKIKVQQGEPG